MVGSSIVRHFKKKGYKNLILINRKNLDLIDQKKLTCLLKKKTRFCDCAAAKVGGISVNSEQSKIYLRKYHDTNKFNSFILFSRCKKTYLLRI